MNQEKKLYYNRDAASYKNLGGSNLAGIICTPLVRTVFMSRTTQSLANILCKPCGNKNENTALEIISTHCVTLAEFTMNRGIL